MSEKILIECFNEMNDTNFKTIVEIQSTGYSEYEVLDSYLRYEGISGYTTNILKAFSLISNF